MSEGVIASAENAAGIVVRPIEIGCGSEIALTTVAIVALVVLTAAVVPVIGACGLAQLWLRITVGVVGNRMDSGTCLTIKDGQVFMATIDASGIIRNPILCVAGGLDCLIGGSLVYIVAKTVL